MLRYTILLLFLVVAVHWAAIAQQPGDDLKRTCTAIAQQRNAALDALAVAQAKMQGMTDEATALAAWWASYVAGLAPDGVERAK